METQSGQTDSKADNQKQTNKQTGRGLKAEVAQGVTLLSRGAQRMTLSPTMTEQKIAHILVLGDKVPASANGPRESRLVAAVSHRVGG